MAALTTDDETTSVPHLRLADGASDVVDLEALTWFAEARRLLAEAEERFTAGAVLPTLSSLTAVPPLHKMLVDRCLELLDPDETEEPDDGPEEFGLGQYL